MLGQMTSVMDNIAALGELTRVGSALAQSQLQPTQPAPTTGGSAQPAAPSAEGQTPPPGAGTPGAPTNSEPARELVGALTEVLRSSTPGDSRLQQTVDRLHNLVGNAPAGSGSANSANQQLAQHPVIQQLQSNMAALQSTVESHGQQIGTITTTLASAAEDSRATREMMERMMGMPQRPPATPQRLGPRPLQTAPSPGEPAAPGGLGGPGGGLAPGGSAEGTLVKPQMTVADHDHALAILGVGGTRQNMTQLSQEISSSEGAVMPCAEWWTQVARCKGLAQWQTKLQSLGMTASAQGTASSFTKVGQLIYSKVQRDGTWSDTDLQTITLS